MITKYALHEIKAFLLSTIYGYQIGDYMTIFFDVAC